MAEQPSFLIGEGATIKIGIVVSPLEPECGDGYAIREWGPQRTLVMVIDGLGHGKKAKEATDTLRGLVAKAPVMPLAELLLWCHARMRQTRGAAVTALVVDQEHRQVLYSGVGNVSLWHADAEGERYFAKRMVSGILGYRTFSPQVKTFSYREGDQILLHTDGLSGNACAHLPTWQERPISLARLAVDRHANGSDDALALALRLIEGPLDILEEWIPVSDRFA